MQTLILKPMVQWSQFEAESPDLASKIRARFEAHPHHVLGTLDSHGAPRLSGINVFFHDGVMWWGSMLGARKVEDVQRDPRLSVYSAPLSENLEGGDASVRGRAQALSLSQVAKWKPDVPSEGVFYAVELTSCHLVEVEDEELVVTMWDTHNGIRIVHRR